jgi:hypothetical protein
MFLHAFQEQVGHSSISRVCIRLFTFTLFTSISLFHYLLFKALLASAFPGAFLFVWIPSPLRIFVVGFFIPFGHLLCLIKWSGKTFYTFFFFFLMDSFFHFTLFLIHVFFYFAPALSSLIPGA